MSGDELLSWEKKLHVQTHTIQEESESEDLTNLLSPFSEHIHTYLTCFVLRSALTILHIIHTYMHTYFWWNGNGKLFSPRSRLPSHNKLLIHTCLLYTSRDKLLLGSKDMSFIVRELRGNWEQLINDTLKLISSIFSSSFLKFTTNFFFLIMQIVGLEFVILILKAYLSNVRYSYVCILFQIFNSRRWWWWGIKGEDQEKGI
jgi:hypothetical protein